MALAVLVLSVVAYPAAAWAACQNTLDFSGAELNDTRTLDVSSCSFQVRTGLYVSSGSIDAYYYFPVSGNVLIPASAPYPPADSANFTLSNGAVVELTPGAASVSEFGEPYFVFTSYTVRLVQRATTPGTGTFVPRYPSTASASNFVSWPVDTDYPITVTNVPANLPEIAVSGSVGGNVDDGQNSFQGILFPGVPVTVTYTVSNSGNADLTLGTVSASSPSNVTVGSIAGPTSPVASGNSTTFQVTYTPTTDSPFFFDLSFATNDPDENPFNFTVSGTGARPALFVSLAPGATPAVQGGTFEILAGVQNSGSIGTSGNVVVTSTLPTGLTFAGGSGTGWDCSGSSGSNVNCSYSNVIPPNGSSSSLSVAIAVAATSPTSQSITAAVSGGGAQGATIDTETVTVTQTPASVTVNAGNNQTTLVGTDFGTEMQVEVRDAASLVIPNASVTFTAPASGASGTFSSSTNAITVTTDGSGIAAAGTFTANATAGAYNVAVSAATAGGSASGSISLTNRAQVAVTGLSPDAGPAAGGNAVVITGSSFINVTGVTFGGVSATYFRDSISQITATAPAGTGTVDVAVSTLANGTSTDTGADDYTYVAAPTVTGVTPSYVSSNGGTTVGIYGANFDGATKVTFGTTDVPASSFASNSGSQIVLNAPPVAAGRVDVTVTTPGGTSATSANSEMVFQEPPAISAAFSPTSIASGGTATLTLTLVNTNPVGALTGVTVAAAPLPANLSGVDGTVSTTCAGDPAYDPGTRELSLGRSIVTNCMVTLQVTSTVPGDYSYTSGVVSDEVAGTGSTATTPTPLTVLPPAPTVTGLSPTKGAPGKVVTITGTNFTGATAVRFAAGAASSFTVDSDTQITATAPSGAAGSFGTVNVSVTTPGGTSADAGTADDFTYGTSPNGGLQFSPGTIPADGSTQTTLRMTLLDINPTGSVYDARIDFPAGLTYSPTNDVTTGPCTGFSADATGMSFAGAVPANSPCSLQVDLVSSVPGSYSLGFTRLSNEFGSDPGLPATLAVNAVPPTITGLSPALGPTAGGTSVTITGTNFTGATAVGFGGTAATAFTVDSATQITATAPAGSAGNVNVTVTTPSGTSADAGAADDFEYGSPPLAGNGGASTATQYTAPNPATFPFNASTGFLGVIEGYYVNPGVNTTETISGVTVTVAPDGTIGLDRPVGFRGTVTFGIRTYNRFGVSVPQNALAQPDGSRLFSLIVGNPTLVSSLSGSGAQQGAALSGYTIDTTGGNAPYSCATTPATGSLPAGVSINADCTLAGTPTENGTFDFTLDVTDSSVGPGAGAASAPNPFTQRSGTLSLAVLPPAPTVTGVSPALGLTSGGTVVTITGTGFIDGATSVSFGGAPATGVSFVSDTEITATTPAGSAGSVNVTVATAGGTSADAGTADDFEYGEAPVRQISFTLTPVYGYDVPNPREFFISSILFQGAIDGYYIGASGTDTSYSASGVTYSVAGGKIVFTRPAGFRGPAPAFEIRAFNRFGASIPVRYEITILDPILNASLTGSGAQQGAALSGYAIDTTGGQAPYSCATSPATGSLPAGVSINADCTLTGTPTESGSFAFTLDVTDSSVDANGPAPFTQVSGTLTLSVLPPAPTVTGLSPALGSTSGGTVVTITGTDFTGATAVTFGGTPATSFNVDGPTQITATSPSGSGTVDVRVTTPGGTSANTAGDDFAYGSPPAPVATNPIQLSFSYVSTNPYVVSGTLASSFTGQKDGFYIGSGTDTSVTVSGITATIDAAA